MPHYPASLDGFHRPLEEELGVILIDQIGKALDFLHQVGLAHMDVKPANIFVDMEGNFFLGDFGSIRSIPSSKSPSSPVAAAAAGPSLGGPIHTTSTSSNTTQTFLPTDLRLSSGIYEINSLHDYWMLGVTMYDVMKSTASRTRTRTGSSGWEGVGTGTPQGDPNTVQVIELLLTLSSKSTQASRIHKKLVTSMKEEK